MALSAEQTDEVTQLLEEHPDWPTSRIRAEAGLSPRELFAVKRLRVKLGVSEPAGDGAGAGQPRRPSRGGKRGGAATSETLDESERPDTPNTPSGPKRAGGAAKRPQSMLAPILPRIAQSGVVALMAMTHNLTRGRAAMSATEAQAVIIPALRIGDRTIAKHWKKSGKVTANQEDAALMAITVLSWLIGVIVANVTDRTRGAQPQQRQPAPAPSPADLFAGSEPLAPPSATGRPAAPVQPPAPVADEGDLFAGSEPLAPGVGGPVADVAGPAGNHRGPALPPVSEAVWAAVMPTDIGEGLIG